MSKILSKGIQLSYEGTSSTYVALTGMTSIPDMGSEPDKVETTDLSNSNRTYIAGLTDFGSFNFGFIFDDTDTQFTTLNGFKGTQKNWKLTIPASSGNTPALTYAFTGEPRVYINSTDVGSRVDYTLSIQLSSDVTIS